jgi:hypothetical protein
LNVNVIDPQPGTDANSVSFKVRLQQAAKSPPDPDPKQFPPQHPAVCMNFIVAPPHESVALHP